jgi:formylglycine-generating enzyme required for sulfatase activity
MIALFPPAFFIMNRSTCLSIRLLLSALSLLIFINPGRSDAPPVAAAPQNPQPLVFAHYMVCYFRDVDYYKREILLAQRYGIDGFALNAGGWEQPPGPYAGAAERMYEAAKQLNTGFRLFISPDGGAGSPDNVVDMITRFKDHPNQLKYNGKPVISSWASGGLNGGRQMLKDKGQDVCFVPFNPPPGFPANWSARAVRSFFTKDGPDGIFYFAGDATAAEQIRTNAICRRETSELGKLFMAGVCPAYNSANLRDFHGMEGYGALWKGVIQNGADWVEITTWNDYNEDTNLMPGRWAPAPLGGDERAYISRDESFLDVTSYYARWFKTGVPPEIKQDKLYYVYRNRSKLITKGWDAKLQRWVDITKDSTSQPVVDQIHDDVEDNIYVTTFLTAPAKLRVKIGTTEKHFDMPAGVGYAMLPMQPGTPNFLVARDGATVLEGDGRKYIIGEATQQNSPQGYHLLNRTWTGAIAAGKAIPLEVNNAALLGTAKKADGGILIPSDNESGIQIPLSKLPTSGYNVRIRYLNPAKDEARLTLIAMDDADKAAIDPAAKAPDADQKRSDMRFFPVFLPPTEGTPKTVSFFWSLEDTETFLKLECLVATPATGQTAPPWASDVGNVTIEGIDLVPIDPFRDSPKRDSPFPEMVSIPGGDFDMGSNDGALDEKPVHKVNVAPFAIGKYDVTNAEYEQFASDHRNFRDEYSWRDRDPVIYISWMQAAGYCNWLSQKAGLQPTYDEKTWEAKPDSNGFRLPTEEEWEYVASGRGEGRKYPWGNNAPEAKDGNFLLEESLDMNAAAFAKNPVGVTPVGAFPAGASRDGVMDMAGNVSQWCSNWYRSYPTAGLPDDASTRYRAIRGGSWGYYNYSQRVAGREFNNPGYPGYVYISFRLVMPEASLKKLSASNP